MKTAVKIASILFVVELLIMLVLDRLGLGGAWLRALLDALVLAAVAWALIQRGILALNARDRDLTLSQLRSQE